MFRLVNDTHPAPAEYFKNAVVRDRLSKKGRRCWHTAVIVLRAARARQQKSCYGRAI